MLLFNNLHEVFLFKQNIPAKIYLFKVINGNTRKRCEICSRLAIKTPERRHWRRSGVFIVNFEHISHLFLLFLLLTLNKSMLAGIKLHQPVMITFEDLKTFDFKLHVSLFCHIRSEYRIPSVNLRSRETEVFLGKGVLKRCSQLTGEHPCQRVISIQLLCNFIEVALCHGWSTVTLLHIFRRPFLKNTSWWLLLKSPYSVWIWEVRIRKKSGFPAGSYVFKVNNRI